MGFPKGILRSGIIPLGTLFALATLFGCSTALPPRTPMPVLRYPFFTASEKIADTLLIFLPGRRDRAPIIEEKGMLEVVRKSGIAADVIAADAHIGYYKRGTFVRQLHDELIEPSRQRGYKRIVLVGISMGAYGALRYAMVHPGRIDTIVLLSPFLGAGPINREIAEAGDEGFEQTRDFIKHYPTDAGEKERTSRGYPRLILGYGDEDLFPGTNAEIRAVLPKRDVFTHPGAHLWSTWRGLLGKILTQDL